MNANSSFIVLTLDAGATNLEFSAMNEQGPVVEPVILPAWSDRLEDILLRIIRGFETVREQCPVPPSAICFCFPGPADYKTGIIGDLENLPCFRGGVPLGPMLEDHFNLPVHILNDGDLFTYGEAMFGLLPEINEELAGSGNPRRFANLLGVTFGTGFGAGIVRNGEIFMGDNSAQAEINRMRNRLYPGQSVEESVSIRGVKRVYARESRISFDESPDPKTIAAIANGTCKGNVKAAKRAWEELAVVAADALANALTLIDGLVVIGGGLSQAPELFIDRLVDEINTTFESPGGKPIDRLEVRVFNLSNAFQRKEFLRDSTIRIPVPFSGGKNVDYDSIRRVGVGLSKMSTGLAVARGAYHFARNRHHSCY